MSIQEYIDAITLDDLERDPYPIYRRLRAEAPVAWIPAADVWFVTGFQDCSSVGNGEYGFVAASGHPTLERVFNAPNVLTSDGEVHTDLRAGIDPRLKPDAVTSVVDDIVRPVARRRLSALDGCDSTDLMASYFEPVSVEALRHVMGLDQLVDANTLRRWFAGLNTGIANFGLNDDQFAIADSVSAEIDAVVGPLIDELRAHPDDSMISHMLWAGVRDGRPRTLETIMPSLKVILLGGMQEPGHAAGSTVHGLFSRPDQLALVVADPVAWAPLAVNEGLRWIAPIGAIERQASVDTVVNGVAIPAGAIVEAMIASANRDETRFDDPDVFDLERSTRSHQAFGAGSHFCAGHFFARQVERIMLEELFSALPTIQASPVEQPDVRGWFFRAPQTLPVVWDATPGPESITVASTRPAGTELLTVTGMRVEAERVISLELRHPLGSDLPDWSPGAHIDLWATEGRAGQYSLTGEPADRSVWRVAVLREPLSRGVSIAVHEHLRPGDAIAVGGPRNNFALEAAQNYCFIAGGIGITAILPMLREVSTRNVDWTLDYCGTSRTSMAFLSELARYGDRMRVHVSSESQRLDVRGVVNDLPADTIVYCCGPERMLEAATRATEARGIPLRVEHFTGVEALRDSDVPFQVHLARRNKTLDVGATETILEVLQQHDIPVLTACGEGNCGSCETRVLGGAIEHRDVLLTPAQRARGDRMMVCVSRAQNERIVLDL